MVDIVVQGLLLSGLYALIAVGFTLIFSIGRVLDLSYGAYIVIGGYVYFVLAQELGMPKVAGVLLAGTVGALFGVLKLFCIVRPLKGDQVAIEIATLILAVIVQAFFVFQFGDSPRTLLPLAPGVFEVGGARVPYNVLVAAAFSWLILLGLYFYIQRTYVGRAMRAVSMDRKGAAISGVNPLTVNVATWGISGALGAVGGVFFASYTQLSPDMWVAPLIIAVAVVIVGGIGSILGTLVVAHLIGFLEVAVSNIEPQLRGVSTMALIILFLILRPKGLFGREEL